MTSLPEVVSREEWEAAHADLLAKEKAATRARDALAAERRRAPMTPMEGDYAFEGPDGTKSLVDLFDGRRQLIVYNFMFDQDAAEPCGGCSFFVDNVPHLAHLRARDTNLVLVSRRSQSDIRAFQERMGWTVPWYTSLREEFYEHLGIRGGFALNVFVRDRDRVYRTYKVTSRGVDALGSVWSFLDLTPFGRQEKWEDSPPGRPQGDPYVWWDFHDSYEEPAAGVSQ